MLMCLVVITQNEDGKRDEVKTTVDEFRPLEQLQDFYQKAQQDLIEVEQAAKEFAKECPGFKVQHREIIEARAYRVRGPGAHAAPVMMYRLKAKGGKLMSVA